MLEGVCDMRCDVISFESLGWIAWRCGRGVGDHKLPGATECWQYVDICLLLQTICS